MMLELVERMKQFVVKSFDYYLSSNQQAEIEKLIYGVLLKIGCAMEQILQ